MKVSLSGLVRAALVLLRTAGAVVLGLILVRWFTLVDDVTGGDATPQLAFVLVVVAPLALVNALGFIADVRWLSRKHHRGLAVQHVTAVTEAFLLAVTVSAVLFAPP